MDFHLVLISDFQHQIIQCEIGLGIHSRLDPALQTTQLAMSAAIALCAWLQPARLALQDDHIVDELHRNPEPSGGRSMGMAFFHKCNNTLPKRYRKWLAHLRPPYLLCSKGITD